MFNEVLSSLPADAVPSFAIISIAIAYAHLIWPKELQKRSSPDRKSGYGRFEGLASSFCWQMSTGCVAGLPWLWTIDTGAVIFESQKSSRSAERAGDTVENPGHPERAGTRVRPAVCGRRSVDQARAVVDDIAAHAGEIRGAFLAQPAVVILLGET